MNRDAGSNLVFFLLGAAVGAGVALLYAPQEGAETRRTLGEKANEVKDKAAEMSHTARERWDGLSAKAQDMLHRGQQAAHDAIDNAADKAHAATDNASA